MGRLLNCFISFTSIYILRSYFDEILKATITDEDVEDVIVEADGAWHTSDGKFASDSWKAANPPQEQGPALLLKRSPTPVKPIITGNGHVNGAPDNAEIVILDSDEEDSEEDDDSDEEEIDLEKPRVKRPKH